jgi:hypothetical protein
MADAQCNHCWHSKYAGQGEYLTYCCHCGGMYFQWDWQYAGPSVAPMTHGPFHGEAMGEHPLHRFGDEEMRAMDMVPREPLASSHTHIIKGNVGG